MSCCEGSTTNICLQAIKYCDHLSERWVWSRAPMRWHRAIDLQFRFVKLEALEPAGSLTRPDVLENWVQRLFQHKSIPPLIVCATPAGKFYVIDGNHRLEAIQRMMGNGFADTLVRVAEIVPKAGYHFRYRWMNSYGTYVLEPVELGRNPLRKRHSGSSTNRPVGLVIEQVRCELEPGLRQLLGRTLFVLAHPDDETACAALLQRTRNPVVLFCTDGAPASEYFWGRYGSLSLQLMREVTRITTRAAFWLISSAGSLECPCGRHRSIIARKRGNSFISNLQFQTEVKSYCG
jgi:hypothetical protein